MLKGTRDALVTKVQPVSIHGQLSLDVHYLDPDDEQSHVRIARVGPESAPHDIEAGQRVTLHFLLGTVTSITRQSSS